MGFDPNITGSNPVSPAKNVSVAQLVEHRPEESGVEGSNPSGYTKSSSSVGQNACLSRKRSRVRVPSTLPILGE